jgi:hypothetical protein
VLALGRDGPAICNIVDDEPAAAEEAPRDREDRRGHCRPAASQPGVARLFARETVVMIGHQSRDASNAKASASSAGRCVTQAGGKASLP